MGTDTQPLWTCTIQTDEHRCAELYHTVGGAARHLARTHREKHMYIYRRKHNCPYCNQMYSNLDSLLVHLKMKQPDNIWKPGTCPVLENRHEARQRYKYGIELKNATN